MTVEIDVMSDFPKHYSCNSIYTEHFSFEEAPVNEQNETTACRKINIHLQHEATWRREDLRFDTKPFLERVAIVVQRQSR